MNRPFCRAAVLAAALLAVVLPAPAHAQLDDPWVRWDVPATANRDAWVRSLDFIGPKLFAGAEDDGIFTSTSPLAEWVPANGGLNTVAKRQIRQVIARNATLYAATSHGLFKSANGTSWVQIGTGAPPRRLTMGGIQTVVANSATDLVVGTASFGVYYSSDSGDHWDKAIGLPANESVFHMVASPSVPSTLYAAASDGVFISTNKGRNWKLWSDGLPYANALRVAVSPLNPSVLYVATTSGVYRSSTGGLIWRPASGTGATALPGSTVRALFLAPAEFGGGGRLMVGTEKGVWATKDSGVTWGQMGKDALLMEPGMANQIVWSLGIGFTPPALLAGTQARGVYSHALLPILANVAPGITPKTGLKVGMTLIAGTGLWKGTKPFFYAFQWKRCSSTGTNCVNILGAKGRTYNLQSFDVGKTIKVAVTASNVVSPAPIEKLSARVPTTGTVQVQPAAAPKPTSGLGPNITPRDVSYAWGQVYTVNPGTWNVNGTKVTPTFKYVWRRCTAAGSCTTLAGQTGKTYASVPDDINRRLEAYVTATFNGASGTAPAGTTKLVIQKTPVNTALPKIYGTAAVGNTLNSSVGTWVAQTPTFERRWLACDNDDGTGCGPIFGATASTFQVTNAQKGKRIRIEVKAIAPDPNQPRTATVQSLPTAKVP